MKISGVRFLCSNGRRVRMFAALALGLACAGDSYAALTHNYLFNSGNGSQIIDSVSSANGSVLNIDDDAVTGIVPADSRLELSQNKYGNLPGATIAINGYSALTFEMWASVSTVHANQYTASVAFGTTVAGSGSQYVMMQPTRGGAAGGSGNFLDAAGGAELVIAGPNDLSDGRIHHTVTTIDATNMSYYVDGVLIDTQPVGARSLANVSTNFAYLGRSVWSGDPRLQGAIYEFRIYDDAKDAIAVQDMFSVGCQDACGEMYMEVDRNTGAATLFNGLSAKNVVISQISSAQGALDPNNWLSITNNYDEDSGGHQFDSTDQWEIVSQTKGVLQEQDPLGQGAEDGGVFDSSFPVPLGNIWTKSPFEDLNVTLTILDENFAEQQISVPVFYINGIDDAPYKRSDFDLDGDIDETDYLTMRAHHLEDLGGTFHGETYPLGDINGDLVNDYLDFRLFKADFIAANSMAAFASLMAGEGAVPEPTTLGLLMLGMAAGALATRRKRTEDGGRNLLAVSHYFSQRCCTMNCGSKTLSLLTLLMMIPAVSNAQTVVGSQNFDAATLGDFQMSGLPGARYYTYQALNPFAEIATPGVGGGGNLLRTQVDFLTGQFNVGGSGFQMPLTGNISPNRVDYNLEFDIRMVQGEPYNPDGSWIFSVGVMSNFTFAQQGGSNYFLNDVPEINNLTPGGDFQHVVFNLGEPDELFFGEQLPPDGVGHWNPVDASNQLAFEFNTIRTPTADVTQIWEIDNVELVLDVAPSLALVVDPTSGKARLRNVATGDVTFDYYKIDSTAGSLQTADFNGTTGWNSLDDQGKDSLGPGATQSWDEVGEANSANRLVEQFLEGSTTLSPGQSVSLGAPINPAVLNNNIDDLMLQLGGPSYEALTFGGVLFEDLSALVGDYNDNGVVDAADYTVWRDHLGQTFSLPNRDPANGSGAISAADYNSWKANFGAILGAGSASGTASSAVPEPAAGLMCVLAICLAAGRRLERGWKKG